MDIKKYNESMNWLSRDLPNADKKDKEPIVYVLQELPGTRMGRPKFNIMGASKYGKLKVLLREDTQIILSPGPVIFELRRLLKDYNSNDIYYYQVIPLLLDWHVLLFLI